MKTVKAKELRDEPVTEAVLEHAIKQGQKRKVNKLHATVVHYWIEPRALMVGFADQSAVIFPVRNYPELDALNDKELSHLHVGFGGSALCLDSKDLHVSIVGLVSASQPLMAMASSAIATRNGSRSSRHKSQTSRENGKLGGRPRKLPAMNPTNPT